MSLVYYKEKKEADSKQSSELENKISKDRKKQLKFLPIEKDEETNKYVHLYNEIVRHAYTFSPYSFKCDLKEKDIEQVLLYVICDCPDLFWISNVAIDGHGNAKLVYRYISKDGGFDKQTVIQKKKQINKAAKKFTRGITRRTSPFKALITIYRRLILSLQYENVDYKNDGRVYNDPRSDDVMNSLYNSLVEHKVECRGYSFAMQYLLQKVGISCGYVVSQNSNNSTYSFNAIRIGNLCYYLDATSGDMPYDSDDNRDAYDISYDYVCVPFKDFCRTNESQIVFHTPNESLYPIDNNFRCISHEYFRHINAFLTNYDENKMAKIFADAVKRYKKKEMGRFTVHFRCTNIGLRDFIANKVLEVNSYRRIIDKAIDLCKFHRGKAIRLFSSDFVGCISSTDIPTAYFVYDNIKKKRHA